MVWTEKTWKRKLLRSQNKGDKKMEQIIKHYAPAVIAILVSVLLGIIIANLLTSDGFVATQFRSTLTDFFTKMSGLMP